MMPSTMPSTMQSSGGLDASLMTPSMRMSGMAPSPSRSPASLSNSLSNSMSNSMSRSLSSSYQRLTRSQARRRMQQEREEGRLSLPTLTHGRSRREDERDEAQEVDPLGATIGTSNRRSVSTYSLPTIPQSPQFVSTRRHRKGSRGRRSDRASAQLKSLNDLDAMDFTMGATRTSSPPPAPQQPAPQQPALSSPEGTNGSPKVARSRKSSDLNVSHISTPSPSSTSGGSSSSASSSPHRMQALPAPASNESSPLEKQSKRMTVSIAAAASHLQNLAPSLHSKINAFANSVDQENVPPVPNIVLEPRRSHQFAPKHLGTSLQPSQASSAANLQAGLSQPLVNRNALIDRTNKGSGLRQSSSLSSKRRSSSKSILQNAQKEAHASTVSSQTRKSASKVKHADGPGSLSAASTANAQPTSSQAAAETTTLRTSESSCRRRLSDSFASVSSPVAAQDGQPQSKHHVGDNSNDDDEDSDAPVEPLSQETIVSDKLASEQQEQREGSSRHRAGGEDPMDVDTESDKEEPRHDGPCQDDGESNRIDATTAQSSASPANESVNQDASHADAISCNAGSTNDAIDKEEERKESGTSSDSQDTTSTAPEPSNDTSKHHEIDQADEREHQAPNPNHASLQHSQDGRQSPSPMRSAAKQNIDDIQLSVPDQTEMQTINTASTSCSNASEQAQPMEEPSGANPNVEDEGADTSKAAERNRDGHGQIHDLTKHLISIRLDYPNQQDINIPSKDIIQHFFKCALQTVDEDEHEHESNKHDPHGSKAHQTQTSSKREQTQSNAKVTPHKNDGKDPDGENNDSTGANEQSGTHDASPDQNPPAVDVESLLLFQKSQQKDQEYLQAAGLLSLQDVLLPSVAHEQNRAMKMVQSKLQRDPDLNADQIKLVREGRKHVIRCTQYAMQVIDDSRQRRFDHYIQQQVDRIEAIRAAQIKRKQERQRQRQEKRERIALKKAQKKRERFQRLQRQHPKNQSWWREVATLLTDKVQLEKQEKMWQHALDELEQQEKVSAKAGESDADAAVGKGDENPAATELTVPMHDLHKQLDEGMADMTVSTNRIFHHVQDNVLSKIIPEAKSVQSMLYKTYRQDHQFAGYMGANNPRAMIRFLSQTSSQGGQESQESAAATAPSISLKRNLETTMSINSANGGTMRRDAASASAPPRKFKKLLHDFTSADEPMTTPRTAPWLDLLLGKNTSDGNMKTDDNKTSTHGVVDSVASVAGTGDNHLLSQDTNVYDEENDRWSGSDLMIDTSEQGNGNALEGLTQLSQDDDDSHDV